jgi:tetraacyldisaccharide 4'-kinase
MRRLRAWLRRLWNGNAGVLGVIVGVLLLPLEVFYRGAVALRNRAYGSGILPTNDPPIPVISVGNLAVGGTGKTPFAGWLVARLGEMGRRPALITRGYGSDEVQLHRTWNPNAILVVDPQRFRGVALAAERGADVAILDDAFQHRAIQRHVDIVLIAAEHGTRRALLPRGRLREGVGSLARADVVVVTRKVASRAEANRIAEEAELKGVCGHVVFEIAEWTDLEGVPLSPPQGEDLLAVTSVAEPESFRQMAAVQTSGAVEDLAFPDHHDFREIDVRRIIKEANGRSIVITQKDAVKLKEFSSTLPRTYVLRLRLVWESGLDHVMALIEGVLESR